MHPHLYYAAGLASCITKDVRNVMDGVAIATMTGSNPIGDVTGSSISSGSGGNPIKGMHYLVKSQLAQTPSDGD